MKKKFRPEITRIKLTPEQAVLTCCDTVLKSVVGWPGGGQQCSPTGGCAGATVNSTSS